MSEFIQILEQGAQSLIDKIKMNMQSAGTTATGKTAESFGYEIINDGDTTILNITANQFAQVIETGRKATPDSKPGYSMIQNITEWVAARGLDSSLVWAIATQINQEGTKLWQQGGREDIYTLPFEEFVKILSNQILDFEADSLIQSLIKNYGSQRN